MVVWKEEQKQREDTHHGSIHSLKNSSYTVAFTGTLSLARKAMKRPL
jgi:hypothetical protein